LYDSAWIAGVDCVEEDNETHEIDINENAYYDSINPNTLSDILNDSNPTESNIDTGNEENKNNNNDEYWI
jgi:hypothetical protein